MRFVFIIFFILLLVYMVWPGPNSVIEFLPLPNSLKSVEPGDTVQVPNVTAYYSREYRSAVIPFYLKNYQTLSALPFAPVRLNYPPEFSFAVIKDQTQSTYLEEFVYPLKGSIFISGFEPFYEDGQPRYFGATDLVINDVFFQTKTILRLYPSPLPIRLLVWIGICLTTVFLWKQGKEVLSSA